MNLFQLLQTKDEAVISPLDADYKGVYPALIKTEYGYANRKTGELYPRDDEGNQRARLKNGKAVGRKIVNKDGIPYGTLKFIVLRRTSKFIEAKRISLATGNEQLVLITEGGEW